MKKTISIFILVFITLSVFSQIGRDLNNSINIGTKDIPFIYSDSKNTTNYNNKGQYNNLGTNQVFYKFTITRTMDISIYNCGSVLDQTYITLYDSNGKNMQVSKENDLKEINCGKKTQACLIKKNLPAGTYYVASQGYLQDGDIITTIKGFYNTLIEQNLGVMNSSFNYTHLADTRNSINNWGFRPTNDAYYHFILKQRMTVIISQCGSPLNSTCITLTGSPLPFPSLISCNNNNKCPDSSQNGYIEYDLEPGSYSVISEGTTENGLIQTSIQGIVPKNEYNAGIINGPFIYSHTQNTANTTNAYEGNPTNDVHYKFTLQAAIDLEVSHSNTNFNTAFWILNEAGQLINYSNYGSKLILNNLSPGIYYIVSEGKTQNGEITTTIKSIWEEDLEKSYITTRTFTSPDGNNHLSTSTYYDGFGRPVQINHNGITPTKKDLISIQEYDLFGRESEKWLPVSYPGNGDYINSEQVKNTTKGSSGYDDQKPYSYPVYETSPLNRLSEQYGPGEAWYNNNKSVTTTYLTNNDTYPCVRFEIENNMLVKKGNYPAGELNVTQIQDEDGNILFEFQDKVGQVILTRQLNGNEKHDTYYVYDIYGNLRYVLPPLMTDKLTADLGDNNEIIKQYAYLYQYDKFNRCIKKRLPGCDWIYMIYDVTDQLILTQDGEQRLKGEWMFNIPDFWGRTVLTGICKNNITESQINNYLNDQKVYARWDSRSIFKGYLISGFPSVSLVDPLILTANYYDDYKHLQLEGFNNPNLKYVANSTYGIRYGDDNSPYQHKGLLTGTITTTMGAGTTNEELYSNLYYDHKKQMIQSRSINHLNGYDYAYTAYDFVGKPTKMYTEQLAHGITTQELYSYTYDHAGRLLETKHKLNNQAETSLAKNEYDELGRLKSSQKANNTNLKTSYTYNIRSWINTIQESQFSENLTYSFNGNIKNMSWMQEGKTRKYDYTYDNLSRLTKAVYTPPTATANERYDTEYAYDKMGNMMALKRYGKIDAATNPTSYGLVDNLTMTYNGNQLTKVTDAGVNVAIEESEDFKDWTNQTIEYAYNKNGAMTKDWNKGISDIQYNSLNLPKQMDIISPVAEARNEYLYSATGQKLRVIQRWNSGFNTSPVIGSAINVAALDKSKVRDYVGNKVYEDNVLKKILIEGGYIENNQYYFYAKDHLGNNRATISANGTTVMQRNHYYPFGAAFADGYNKDSDSYKYNGKEQDIMHGLDWYDYSARYATFDLPRFTTMDPLAEIFYNISPYAYCGNNPINRIDPTGMAYSTTNPNHWERLFNHLESGKGLDSFDTDGWEETEDPGPPQDIIPPPGGDHLMSNYYYQQGLKNFSSTWSNAMRKGTQYSLRQTLQAQSFLLYTIFSHLVAVSIKVSVVASAGGAGGASLEGILILQGPHAGTFIVAENGYAAVGTIHAEVSGVGTAYYYLGNNMDNVTPASFRGESFQAALGADFLGHLGISGSYNPNGGRGAIIGASPSLGIGESSTAISFDMGVEITKIVYIKDLK